MALVCDDLLHQLGVGILAHCLVSVATHADGYDLFGALHAFDSLTEELLQSLLVLLIVPGTPTLTVACIFLVVASHRLMVGGSHHNAHLVGGLLVLRVIGIESPSPHGWPHHVASQAEHQFEYSLVESVVAILRAVGVLHPRREARSLVVEEDATIAHGWFAIRIDALVDEDGVVVFDRHVSPVVPRRYAHLLRELVDAIDGATAIASGNDQLTVDEGDDEFLVLALEELGIEAT